MLRTQIFVLLLVFVSFGARMAMAQEAATSISLSRDVTGKDNAELTRLIKSDAALIKELLNHINDNKSNIAEVKWASMKLLDMFLAKGDGYYTYSYVDGQTESMHQPVAVNHSTADGKRTRSSPIKSFLNRLQHLQMSDIKIERVRVYLLSSFKDLGDGVYECIIEPIEPWRPDGSDSGVYVDYGRAIIRVSVPEGTEIGRDKRFVTYGDIWLN